MTTPEPLPEWRQYPAEPPVGGAPYLAQPPATGAPYVPQPPAAGVPYLAQPPHPPQYQPYAPHAYRRPTNGMAIASMVLGIVWVYWIGSILALIFGHVALNEIRRTGQGGEGMAITGIVLGWIGVGVFLIGVLVMATRGFS